MNDENQTNGNEETLDTQDTNFDDETIDLDLSEEEEEVDWQSKAEKAQELINNYKIRAEKAEGKLKSTKIESRPTNANSELSTMDIIAFTKSSVDMSDIESVTKFARMEGISISEALESDELKAMLDVKKEKRNVAQASHTGTARRSNLKLSDDVILRNAQKGSMPDSDEDFEKLFNLKLAKKNRT